MNRGSLTPYPSRQGPFPFLKKVNSSFIVKFWFNLKHNIFICLPKIIEIQIYEWKLPYPMGAPPPLPFKKSNSSFIVRFLSNLKHNIFICLIIIIEIEIYEYGPHYPPGAFPPPSE